MKKILKRKKKYGTLDICKLFLLMIVHFALWLFFTSLLYFANFLITDDTINEIFNKNKFLTIYIVILSPVISYVFYAIYHEKGWINIKAILWIHSMLIIIISIIQLIFFNL